MKTIEEFKKKGYVVIRNAISTELRNFIAQYALFDEMQDFSPDGCQVPAAHAKYADPAMETMLLHLQTIIEASTGLKVYPTYSFYRIYRPGDELLPHTDRQSCEISITICLGFEYVDPTYEWPIVVDGVPHVLHPGDLICYRGVDLKHWRKKFTAPEGSWHVQAFLHYVDVNGPYADFKYDQRNSIGELKMTNKESNIPSYIEFTK